MSHHGYDHEQNRAMSEMMERWFGEFPNGKLNKDDAGALAVSIGHEKDAVVIRFPKPVAWIGFTPEQAIEIAESLIQHARALGVSRPVSLTIGR